MDAYIARFSDFPPSRVDVVHRAPTLDIQALHPHSAVETAVTPQRQAIRPAWQPIVTFLQQRQNVPARPNEIVVALGYKPATVAAYLRFMMKAGIIVSREVGQGPEKKKGYVLTTW